MTIGLLHIDLLIPGARSLKEKRRVVKGLKEQLRNRYNCSVAEVGDKEKWGRARLAVCVVGDDSQFVNTQLNEVARFASGRNGAEVIDYQIEMM